MQKQTEIKGINIVYKKEGETPLERVLHFKKQHPKYKNVPMTYAGRLDPMAEGLLLLLAGEECKKKDEYQKLPKTYEVEVLFGFETDTYDILGEVKSHNAKGKIEIQKLKVEKVLKSFVGKFRQEYPAFSSKTVGGKPLFAYARGWTKSGRLPKKMPKKLVEIFSIKTGKLKKINSKKLLKTVTKRILKVKGDFRQKSILKKWNKSLEKEKIIFQTLPLTVSCGSGTYMRSLAHKLGEKLKIPALAYKIKRTRVGKYKI